LVCSGSAVITDRSKEFTGSGDRNLVDYNLSLFFNRTILIVEDARQGVSKRRLWAA
jgi:hypothetical protein